MNRIATPHETVSVDFDSRFTLDFTPNERRRPPTRQTTYIPLHYESGYAYPLIIWLSGRGTDEEYLAEVMPLISLRNYVGVSVRGSLVGQDDCEPAISWDLGPQGVELATEAVEYCIESVSSRLNVSPQRVFLAGHADGGTMAMRIALANPRLFAGVASLGGALPHGRAPLARLKLSRDLEVLLAHGRGSELYPEDAICEDLRLLHYAGLNVTLRQYSHGDELSERMLSDVDQWAMRIVTGHRQAASVAQDFEVN